jgi:hypothetical protein
MWIVSAVPLRIVEGIRTFIHIVIVVPIAIGSNPQLPKLSIKVMIRRMLKPVCIASTEVCS